MRWRDTCEKDRRTRQLLLSAVSEIDMVKKIAVTGTIAAGKSTLSDLLRELALPVFDADAYARVCLTKGHPIMEKIIAEFGTGILQEDGEIDRKKLAGVVFHNEEARQKLNGIVHPGVREGLVAFFQEHEREKLCFAEVPLLYEAGWEDLFDLSVVVACGEETAVHRMVADRGYTEEDARARLASQLNKEEQIARADKVFMNDGSVEQFREELKCWLKELEDCHGTEE